MKKFDISDSFIASIELPNVKENNFRFGSQFEKGLNLVIKWRNGVAKASKEQARLSREDFFRFIWRLRYVKSDGTRTNIDLGFWPAMNQDAAVKAAAAIKLAVVEG